MGMGKGSSANIRYVIIDNDVNLFFIYDFLFRRLPDVFPGQTKP